MFYGKIINFDVRGIKLNVLERKCCLHLIFLSKPNTCLILLAGLCGVIIHWRNEASMQVNEVNKSSAGGIINWSMKLRYYSGRKFNDFTTGYFDDGYFR